MSGADHSHEEYEHDEVKVQKVADVLVYVSTALVGLLFVLSTDFDAALPMFFAVIWMLFTWGMRKCPPVSIPMAIGTLFFAILAWIFMILPSWIDGKFSVWWIV